LLLIHLSRLISISFDHDTEFQQRKNFFVSISVCCLDDSQAVLDTAMADTYDTMKEFGKNSNEVGESDVPALREDTKPIMMRFKNTGTSTCFTARL
jgi:hypothetical protein